MSHKEKDRLPYEDAYPSRPYFPRQGVFFFRFSV